MKIIKGQYKEAPAYAKSETHPTTSPSNPPRPQGRREGRKQRQQEVGRKRPPTNKHKVPRTTSATRVQSQIQERD